MADHPLTRLLVDAANGRFPVADLAVEVVGPPPGRADAVVAFSGHNLVAASVDAVEVRAHLADDDPGRPMSAPFLTWLGTRLGAEPGSLDVVLVAAGVGGGASHVTRRDDADADARVARVARARAHRSEVVVHADPEGRGLVILGRGLAGRLEVSVEVPEVQRGRGIGTRLARAALVLAPADEPVFAQVAPGNVASLRAFLAAGYRPICSEVLFLHPT